MVAVVAAALLAHLATAAGTSRSRCSGTRWRPQGSLLANEPSYVTLNPNEAQIMVTPPPLQTNFLHSALYSLVFLQITNHLFPGGRRTCFKYNFALQQDQSQVTPADTVWGAPEAPKTDTKAPGQYV
jgi:hypothetical protein